MRALVWFSCGAASATAAYLALKKYNRADVELVYCDVMSTEHPDNERFLRDVEKWLDVTVTRIASTDYDSIDDVFVRERWMAGIQGARCTVEMKKVPRHSYQRPDDIHIFGYTTDEVSRVLRFKEYNPEIITDWILIHAKYDKQACLDQIRVAGIELPEMYKLGFRNNNCIGCVKATSPEYWGKVRRYFPEHFKRRAEQSREIGCRLVRVDGERVFLDELPDHFGEQEITEDLFCGPECATGMGA